jgi:hypothetical protein
MRLGAFYHWSPADRHDSIRRDGLVPGSLNVVCSQPYEYVCLGPDPAAAWALSGAVAADINGFVSPQGWDLWQVDLADTDEIHLRAQFGAVIDEIQVRNRIPAHRVIYLARRSPATPPATTP